MTLFGWLPKINGKLQRGGNQSCRSTQAQQVAATRLRLEELEERLTPSTFNTTTNVAVGITPSLLAHRDRDCILDACKPRDRFAQPRFFARLGDLLRQHGTKGRWPVTSEQTLGIRERLQRRIAREDGKRARLD